jgi:hypothetical protein
MAEAAVERAQKLTSVSPVRHKDHLWRDLSIAYPHQLISAISPEADSSLRRGSI